MANFRTPNTTVNAPQFTTIPPQIHHQKATFYHPFSPKPPAKTQKLPPRKKSLNKNLAGGTHLKRLCGGLRANKATRSKRCRLVTLASIRASRIDLVALAAF